MAPKTTTQTGNGDAEAKSPLQAVVKGQGRSYVWIASQTGYTPKYISAVANRRRTGSKAFHIAMQRLLETEYPE